MTLRRVILAGAIAASSRRVHLVLKLDVEPGTAEAIAAALDAQRGRAFEAPAPRLRRKGAPSK